ncbi:acetylhydrolase [Streptomyces tateyamensis]|uniref:Acetylhydrolase n=1 Tax=Streptomyces tateyamensis TaxID=565073 RepID=A0A2V4P3X0_9ACTN|nr:acetylhydrolase [Streptomyces tateyamensis]PYC84696.1 acetylhydrolase [Streptomyces tateyamensis]
MTDRQVISRRRMLAAAVGAGLAAPLLTARAGWAAAPVGTPGAPGAAPGPGSGRLVLSAPTGPHPVGVVDLNLVDHAHLDPAAGPGRYRELPTSIWYPARDAHRHPQAPWMPDESLLAFITDGGYPIGVSQGPLTSGHVAAPVHRTGRGCPVLLYSHGAHSHRSDATLTVQELASHGYVVVTMDHTWDAFTRFRDGRVGTPWDNSYYPGSQSFADDLRLVLDRIEDLAAGRNPDAGRRPLPDGLAEALDLDRVGLLGWSKGGAATALAMAADPRVKAGLSLDGTMEPGITTDLDRPFMMMTARFTRAADPHVAAFWARLKGWRLEVQAAGAVHTSYTDAQYLYPQLAKLTGLTDAQLQNLIGTLDPDRAVRIQQAYPLAFFDQHLRHRRSRLLEGPSAAFPEVAYLP